MLNQNHNYHSDNLRAIVIDDEWDCIGVMEKLLKEYCPEVELIGTTNDSLEGIDLIIKKRPNILFLDIEMPVLNGFQILEKIGSIDFQLIFTTAYDRYAVKAFKYSALDYLLKPIDPRELISAIQKVKLQHMVDSRQLEILKRQLSTPTSVGVERLTLPYQNGFVFIDVKDILFVEADNYYIRVQMVSDENYIVSKTLKDIEDILDGQLFFRIHRHYLVNTAMIKKFLKAESVIIMSNNRALPVARNRKDNFEKLFIKL